MSVGPFQVSRVLQTEELNPNAAFLAKLKMYAKRFDSVLLLTILAFAYIPTVVSPILVRYLQSF